jgi:hypothetical protein
MRPRESTAMGANSFGGPEVFTLTEVDRPIPAANDPGPMLNLRRPLCAAGCTAQSARLDSVNSAAASHVTDVR